MNTKIVRAPRYEAYVPQALARMPRSIEELDRVTRSFFCRPRQIVFGFETVFIASSGARKCEAAMLRYDAHRGEPGWISPDRNILCVRRGSLGYLPVNPNLAELFRAMRRWGEQANVNSPWFFPSPADQTQHVPDFGLSRALSNLAATERCSPVSCAGLRAFYVSMRISQGVPWHLIASEIGLRLPWGPVRKRMLGARTNSNGLTFTRKAAPPWSILFEQKPTSNLSAAEIAAFLGHHSTVELIKQVYGGHSRTNRSAENGRGLAEC